jgi:hypothetical protein
MTSPSPAKTKCRTCDWDYDPTDPKAVEHHTKGVPCSKRCTRCDGKPACYFCMGSFCFCTAHC